MPGNRNGDSYNFQSLQEEAVKRAREMQARAHFPAPDTSMPAGARPAQEVYPHSEQLPIHEKAPAPPPAPPPVPEPEEPAEDAGLGLLDTLLKDNERTLIWVLLLILLEEKADTALIFALMYLVT
ncbi:hypothetical protein EQM14_15870 [Caproiciproducens sp. NJN-50]|uniref:hypothetical protein n=1 Tax=Acutalibacteraceae TaxID=3082771 RepID=UPI000FFE10DE|nr:MULTISPECIES: hypothetical protein [Acutalibacteraceae]QAT51127.1 hypothetical protein EQM14_15870 [Caproiciproducens sp. NJN-50]